MKKNIIIGTASLVLGTLVLIAQETVKLDAEKIIGRSLNADEVLVDQKDKLFSHTNIVVKAGQKILFHNSDGVAHNVFSRSKINPFTIKIQKPGETSEVEFKELGTSEVRCAIHPKMKLIVTVK